MNESIYRVEIKKLLEKYIYHSIINEQVKESFRIDFFYIVTKSLKSRGIKKDDIDKLLVLYEDAYNLLWTSLVSEIKAKNSFKTNKEKEHHDTENN